VELLQGYISGDPEGQPGSLLILRQRVKLLERNHIVDVGVSFDKVMEWRSQLETVSVV
jgi:hypothetical protein